MDDETFYATFAESYLAGSPDLMEPKLYMFKRKRILNRVRRILGFLNAICPKNLLDVGSGKGTFLWPCLERFPDMQVTAIDNDETRANGLRYVHDGGLDRLTALKMDATRMDFEQDAFDVVTVLEVLEHIPDYRKALLEACRVARRFVVVSVPSKEDDNPEHLKVIRRTDLDPIFVGSLFRPKYEWADNHMFAFATKS